jgi:hypothetical protein
LCDLVSWNEFEFQTARPSLRGAKHTTRKKLSSPARAGDPVRRGFSVRSLTSLEYWIVRRSLSSGGHSADPVADDDSGKYSFAFSRRDAPEVCK